MSPVKKDKSNTQSLTDLKIGIEDGCPLSDDEKQEVAKTLREKGRPAHISLTECKLLLNIVEEHIK